MASTTEAQEEFNSIVAKASAGEKLQHHPSDTTDYQHDRDTSDIDEEEDFKRHRVEDDLRGSFLDRPTRTNNLSFPPREFDNGRTTGVKGVIADARSYEEAKRSGSWRNRAPRANIGSQDNEKTSSTTFLRGDGEGSDSEDETFMQQWRQSRRDELVKEGNDIRNRRTSPSVRRYGKFDEVDAMGYLDAIEKVTRDTIVVVFVYDPESVVSQVISDAIEPLVPAHPAIHFVRVHFGDIEFDPAAVPALLGYKNQGDLFANLTYIIGQIPDDTLFDTDALVAILKSHHVL